MPFHIDPHSLGEITMHVRRDPDRVDLGPDRADRVVAALWGVSLALVLFCAVGLVARLVVG